VLGEPADGAEVEAWPAGSTILVTGASDAGAQALAAEMDADERARFPFDTAVIDWTDYLEGHHMPRIHEMVTAATAARSRAASAP
jgi:hypothetical protein